jgi:hypothetical protein
MGSACSGERIHGGTAFLLQLTGAAVILDPDSLCAKRDGEEE